MRLYPAQPFADLISLQIHLTSLVWLRLQIHEFENKSGLKNILQVIISTNKILQRCMLVQIFTFSGIFAFKFQKLFRYKTLMEIMFAWPWNPMQY